MLVVSSAQTVLTSSSLLLSFVLGAFSHIFIYRHGEWDGSTLHICKSYFAAICIFTAGIVISSPSHDPTTWLNASLCASTFFLVHFAGVAWNISLYRLFFHPLREFPGPVLARWSGWWWTFKYARTFHMYDELQALHAEYGDYVRVGPNTVSIRDPTAMSIINSAGTTTTKGSFYDFALPKVLINTERDEKKHAQRRKTWESAFSMKALRSYEPIMNLHANKLSSTIEASVGEPVNISETLNQFAFGLMSQFAFGKTYIPSETSEVNFIVDTMHQGGTSLGVFALVPWIFRIVRALPFLGRPLVRFDAWAHQVVVERRAVDSAPPDVFQHMLTRFEETNEKTPALEMQLESDAITIAIAGTDTTAAALTAILWYLATHPKHIQILRNELASISFEPTTPDHGKLASLKHLRAVIDESMRLCPPAPVTGVGWRMTPSTGLQLGSRFTPGGVQVFVAPYIAHHDERFFVNAESFIPERWTDRKAELVREGSLFMPFSMGPHGCVGKSLALAEIRLVIASLMARFDIEVGSGETQETFRGKQRDMLTMMYGDIKLVFRVRDEIA